MCVNFKLSWKNIIKSKEHIGTINWNEKTIILLLIKFKKEVNRALKGMEIRNIEKIKVK